jgi:hypothetical protein
MANSTTTQILIDGPRNMVVKYEGVLDTSDVSYVAIIDPATASPMFHNGDKASTFRVVKVTYSIEDGLSVNLFWDATTPVRIEELVGRGKMEYRNFGGLKNNAVGAAGFTGKIGASTQGWSGVLSFSLVIELIKCQ